MAEISQITLPSGTVYDIKDAWARGQISAITGGSALVFKGVSTAALTDGGTQNPTVNGQEVTEKVVGDIYFFENKEYIWGPNPAHATDNTKPEYIWHELGSTGGLKQLAFKDSASTVYQPAGTINALTFTGDAITMSTTYTPTGGVVVSVTSSSNTKYGVSSTNTGTATYKPAGTIAYQPSGSVSFTTASRSLEISTSATGTKSYQPTGTVSFTTQSKTLNISASTVADGGNYRPAGTVSSTPIGLDTAGSTTAINSATAKNVANAVTVAAPGATAPANNLTYYSVNNENLSLYQIGYTTTPSVTTASVTVKTGDATYKMNGTPTFSGTSAQLDIDSFTLPLSATFTGDSTHLVADSFILPTAATFTGTSTTMELNGTAVRLVTDSISVPTSFSGTFNGIESTISVSGTPSGNITQPVFTGTTTTITVS